MVEMLESAAAPYVSFSLGKRPQLLQRSNKQHYLLLEALYQGDLEESVRLTIAHLDATLQALINLGIDHPSSQNREELNATSPATQTLDEFL